MIIFLVFPALASDVDKGRRQETSADPTEWVTISESPVIADTCFIITHSSHWEATEDLWLSSGLASIHLLTTRVNITAVD